VDPLSELIAVDGLDDLDGHLIEVLHVDRIRTDDVPSANIHHQYSLPVIRKQLDYT